MSTIDMYKLFADQARDVDAIRDLICEYRAVLYQAATGSGKTVVAGYIAQAARKKGRRILILVHRRELVRQFVNTLTKAGLGQDVGVVCRGFAPAPWAQIQVAMVFSWCRRKPHFKPDLIFVDEAHHAKAESWHNVLAWYPNARIIGMTATPLRLDGQGLDPPFEAIHCGLSISELIALKRLAPTRVIRVPVGFGGAGLKKTAGEYNLKQMDSRATPKVVANATNVYLNYLIGKRTIMFGVTKRHARDTANSLIEAGVRAAYVADETPEAVRDETFRKFSDGMLDVVCNVGLIDEGFDVPTCDAVMDVAHTASLGRYMQRAGRYMRYLIGKVGILADCVGNTYRHGLPDIDRHWSLSSSQEGNGAPVNTAHKGTALRCCKSCLTLFESRYSKCPYCGDVHDGRPVSEVDVELIEAMPSPPKPKPEPKMNKRTRSSIVYSARILHHAGSSREAFNVLVDAAISAGYDPNWAHVIADTMKIPQKERHRNRSE